MAGDQLAENIVNETTQSLIGIINDAYQNCTSSAVQNENLIIQGNVGSTINIGDISFSESASALTDCEETASFTTNISQDIQNEATLAADAVNSSLFNLNDETAINVANITTQLATAIDNEYQSNCTFSTLQNESVEVIQNYDSTININSITFDEDLDVMNSCILDASSVTDLQEQLKDAVDADATAKANSIFIILLVIFIIGIIIVIIIVVIFIPGAAIVGAAGGALATGALTNDSSIDTSDPEAVLGAAIQAQASK